MAAKSLTKITSIVLLGILIIGCNSAEKSNEFGTEAKVKAEPSTPAEFVEQAVFTDLEGNPVPISDFKGKVVMIDFWETWCKPCLASFPTLQKLQEEYPDRFKVLAVTPGFTDNVNDARNFAEEHAYDFAWLMDSNGLHKKLGVQGIPYKVFVDADGKFIKKSLGTSGPQEDYKMIKEIIEKHAERSETRNGA